MRRTQVYLPPDQHRALLQEAAGKGISLTELIRRIVARHLEQKKGEAAPKGAYLKIVGLGASGLQDVSQQHDRYLGEEFKEWR